MKKFSISALIIISIVVFIAGYSFGSFNSLKWCINFGLNFVNLDGIIDKSKIVEAVIKYKSSLGGWAFDPASPFAVTNGT